MIREEKPNYKTQPTSCWSSGKGMAESVLPGRDYFIKKKVTECSSYLNKGLFKSDRKKLVLIKKLNKIKDEYLER